MTKSININWNKEVLPVLLEQLESLNSQGIVPTLRGMYYRLLTFDIFHNIKDPYKGLGAYTGKLRKRTVFELHSKLPKLPIDCFADDTRRVVKDWNGYQSPHKYLNNIIDSIRDFPRIYRSNIPRWLEQPHYVEIWVEKKALTRTILNILGDRQVRIVPLSGYSSIPFMYENMQRLENNVIGEKVLHILYLGDLDPSGEDIQNNILANLDDYGLDSHVDFRRIGVTDQQRTEYNLPISLDDKIKEKLGRDPRSDLFVRRRRGDISEPYQVEVDAFVTLRPDEFKHAIIDPIDNWFDWNIYDDVMKRHNKDYLSQMLKEKVIELYNNIGIGTF